VTIGTRPNRPKSASLLRTPPLRQTRGIGDRSCKFFDAQSLSR
jgi:hypothetical protein